MRVFKYAAWIMVVLAVTGIGVQAATTWNEDVSAGAAWSTAGNWSAGVPDAADEVIFTNTQTTTYDVDVDVDADVAKFYATQGYTLNGTGSITANRNDGGGLNQTLVYDGTSGALTFDVPVDVQQDGAGYAEAYVRYGGGSLIFNDAVSMVGSGNDSLNLSGLGTIEFKGNIDLGSGTFRAGKDGLTVTIGGSGTSAAASHWIFARAVDFNLNRTDAYDTTDSYLYMEKSMLNLGADNAIASGTDVRLKASGGTGGITAQGYDQEFGWLDVDEDYDFDLNDSDSVWTFAESSGQAWNTAAALYITNAAQSTIRFALDGSDGLSDSQIGQIVLDGETMAPGDTWTEGNYLYLVPEPATFGMLLIAGSALLIRRRIG